MKRNDLDVGTEYMHTSSRSTPYWSVKRATVLSTTAKRTNTWENQRKAKAACKYEERYAKLEESKLDIAPRKYDEAKAIIEADFRKALLDLPRYVKTGGTGILYKYVDEFHVGKDTEGGATRIGIDDTGRDFKMEWSAWTKAKDESAKRASENAKAKAELEAQRAAARARIDALLEERGLKVHVSRYSSQVELSLDTFEALLKLIPTMTGANA